MSGDLLEQNAQMFNQVSSNFSAFQVNFSACKVLYTSLGLFGLDLFLYLVLLPFEQSMGFMIDIYFWTISALVCARYIQLFTSQSFFLHIADTRERQYFVQSSRQYPRNLERVNTFTHISIYHFCVICSL